MLDSDYRHIPIKSGTFGSGKSVEVNVNIPRIDGNNRLQFEIVQEGIAWIPKTAVFF